MGEALRGSAPDGGGGRGALTRLRIAGCGLRKLSATALRCASRLRAVIGVVGVLLLPSGPLRAQDEAPVRQVAGRFTFLSYPADAPLARSLLQAAQARDTFPGLPRPEQAVVIALAPDGERFREWIGPYAPEWGAAIAFPEARRIVMQGRRSGSDAGDPFSVLRHELAHLALYEYMGSLPPRWFDEGYAAYAARETAREELLAANFALALRGVPTLDELEEWFETGEGRAQTAYALAYRAVSDIAALDPQRGLSLFLAEWRTRRTFDGALRAAYGTTMARFEQGWMRRTRMRYGVLALFTDMTLGLVVFFAIMFPLYAARRRRYRRRLEALIAADVAAEAEAEAARASALDELLKDDERR